MNILVSNDDGVHSPGLAILVESIRHLTRRLAVVAPDRNLSGASSSLTLSRPLFSQTRSDGFVSIDGTPTDCVHLAITGMLDFTPDRVISGINLGANLGDDVLYSGTVAAALEGRFLANPAIAVSLVGNQHFATAGKVVANLISQQQLPGLPNTILNINVPDLPYNKLQGYKITRLGFRSLAQPCHQTTTPRGQPCYWIAEAGHPLNLHNGTDFAAIAEDCVSITPLHIDMTNHSHLDTMQSWLQHSNLG